MSEQLEKFFKELGFEGVKYIQGKGYCGVQKYAFTYGLVYNIDITGYQGRYCYPNKFNALAALQIWDGQGDPPGLWIKHKGDGIDKTNPLLKDEYEIENNSRNVIRR
jgi:hypothetical protein